MVASTHMKGRNHPQMEKFWLHEVYIPLEPKTVNVPNFGLWETQPLWISKLDGQNSVIYLKVLLMCYIEILQFSTET